MRVRLRQVLYCNQVILCLGREKSPGLSALGQQRAKAAPVRNIQYQFVHALIIAPIQPALGQVIADNPALIKFHRPADYRSG